MLSALIAYLAALGKIYTARARQNIRPPFLVLNQVSAVPDQDELCGTGATSFEYQLDIYAADHVSAEPVVNAAFALLNRPGEVFTIGGWYVGNCRVTSIDDNTELEYTGSASAMTRITLTAQIHAQKAE